MRVAAAARLGAVRVIGSGLVAAIALGGGLARAGEQLTPEMLARGADAAAIVAVTFGSGPPRIAVERWVYGDASAADPAWLGPCLPGPELLRAQQARHPRFRAAQPLWRRALREGGYRSVLVLRDGPDGRRPYCETESLLAQHWTAHPRHAEWRASFDAALSRRTRPPENVPDSHPAPCTPTPAGASAAARHPERPDT